MRPFIVCTAFAVLGVSCNNSTAPEPFSLALSYEDAPPADGRYVRRLAQISHYGDPLHFSVPSTGQVGVPLEALVTTYSGGCISDDTVVVLVEGSRAEILPMQRVPSKPAVCTMELLVRPRPVSLVFNKAGTAQVRVTGRAAPGDSLIAATRSVQIAVR